MKASHLVHCRGDEFTIDSGMSGSKARHSTLKRAPRRQDLCLDTGHFAYGGDPVRLVRRHHHRIRYLHLKSVDPVVRAKVKAEKIPFVKAVGLGVFSDLSEGVVDFPALRDIPREVNYDGWATVEQDMYPARSTNRCPSPNEPRLPARDRFGVNWLFRFSKERQVPFRLD